MKMNVLVVDDDEVLRNELTEWLKREGYETEMATSGEEAIELVKRHDFDLVLSDLKIPGKNGIEVLKTVRDLRPNAHMVMITAYATIDTAVEAMKLGADDYIRKPFEMSQLRTVLDNVTKTIEFERKIEKVKDIRESKPENPYRLFKSMIPEDRGLCITRQNPDRIIEMHGLQNVPVIWLTQEESGDNCIHPRDVHELKLHIESFFKKNPDGVLLFDGIYELIEQHSWAVAEKFISDILSKLVQDSSRLIIAVSPDRMKGSALAELRHLISKPFIHQITVSLSSPIRRSIVRLLFKNEMLRFTDILKELKFDDPPKLSFHLKKLTNDKILQRDDKKRYSLSKWGNRVAEYLVTLERNVVSSVPGNVSLVLADG
jgi:CheY-like chemotaxis protein